MIGYLKGEVLESSDGKLVVLAGPGVGYQVSVPQGAQYDALLPGRPVELFVHTHVREDALDLFGFSSRMEKELFLTLLSVNGIGPKGALGILSKVGADSLIETVLEGDRDSLTKTPGIGKKTAERIVLELADPIRKKIEAGTLAYRRAEAASGRAAGKGRPAGASHRDIPSGLGDAKAALLNLGYREPEITTLLNRVVSENPELAARAEDLIRTALRQLA